MNFAQPLLKSNIHRQIKAAFYDMRRAETDHDYESAKATFNDLARQLAGIAANPVGVVPSQDFE
jgi:hypothetical protein